MPEDVINAAHPPDAVACKFIYTFASHESERELCRLELTELLKQVPHAGSDWVCSDRLVDPDRSPFISARMDVLWTGRTAEEIACYAAGISLGESTFKVVCLKAGEPLSYEEQRSLERLVGGSIRGKAEMKSPDVKFGLMLADGAWTFGRLEEPERAWLAHKRKPQNYSTGLSSRVARALVNISAPETAGTQIDPCCGMGNVLIEALSMGMDIRGCDINPLAVRGARANLRHYGHSDKIVSLGDMNDLSGHFDAAVLDLPYNVCSVFPPEEKRRMLSSLRRMADRAVIVSTEPLWEFLPAAGWNVIDMVTTRKGSFVRDIWLCQ